MVRLLSGFSLVLLLLMGAVGCNKSAPTSEPPAITPSKGDPPLVPGGSQPSPVADKKVVGIKVLIPRGLMKATVKVGETELEADEKALEDGVVVMAMPNLEAGKAHVYKVETTLEPNNYTKIVRTRQIGIKADEEAMLDVRAKDDKIPDNVIIRWVPTPRVVVKDMCELAKVGPNDVVMDPGCGDAVMVITAVADFKAKRGKGTDLDPRKVEESQASVKKAGLEGKITIKEGNALKLTADDLKDVTVVMLYMGDELNVRLRPLLWEFLPVGARVVSHRFIMGDWAPDKSITVNREGDYGVEDFELHVWTITGKEKSGTYKKTVAPDKKTTVTLKTVIPKSPTETTLKVDGKQYEPTEQAAREGTYELVIPGLEPGKSYTYKIEATIVPNNYTKIFRTREVMLKAGEEATVDFLTEDRADRIEVRWVPTPPDVVDRMCELAKVTREDVIHDYGCGDAVMLIRPIQKFGAKKGFGNDVDPKMVKLAQENVEKAGLKDRISIVQGDILKMTDKDCGEATVVLLYIGDDLGARLAPVLQKALKPGARIVSHRFVLGDWKPDSTIKVTGEDGEDYVLHLWVVPEAKKK